MDLERLFYEQWALGATQWQNSSHRKRSRSRSPLRNGERKKKAYKTDLPIMKVTNDIDFEKERREIDLEMQRREEIERKELPGEKNMNDNVVKQSSIIPNVAEHDLRVMLEKSRETAVKGSDISNIVASSVMTSRVNETIPGFDYSRLGCEPSCGNKSRPVRIFSNEDSNERDTKADMKRGELFEYFKHDCDTVAFVTQMLINENPALEQPLVEALNGVLQKVRRKHMGLLSR